MDIDKFMGIVALLCILFIAGYIFGAFYGYEKGKNEVYEIVYEEEL